MLLDGATQAEVRRHWNTGRTNWLSASGISRHARRHLDRPYRDLALPDSLPFHPLGRRPKPRQREVLEAIIDGGVAAISAGIVVAEPRDMIAALQERENVELQEARLALRRLLHQLDLLVEAIELHLPFHIWTAILDDYFRLLDEDEQAQSSTGGEGPM